MVLGFGSKRRKPPTEPVFIRASPSLPELAQQRIPWPEDLVDIDAVHALGLSEEPSASEGGHGTPHGASKMSFHGTRGPVPFHKPFRAGDSAPSSPKANNFTTPVGSGVPLPPPSSFNGVGSRARAGSYPRSTRRAKHAPTFNVMVVGATQTGKSSLLRLLLDTSIISPTNTEDQLTSLSTYRSSSARPTSSINSVRVDILQCAPTNRPAPEDRITLTCIDTPGLDFSEGKEFGLDRAVSSIVRYVDLQFAETMGEESKVNRTSKGDQHVHLCIYLIDPDSIMTPSARQARSRLAASAFPAQPLSPGELPAPSEYDSGSEEEDVNTADSDDEYGDPEPPAASARVPLTPISSDGQGLRDAVNLSSQVLVESPSQPRRKTVAPNNRLGMSPAEIRVVARLAKRVNVLPVVARADTLTDGRLERVKRAVRRDLKSVEIEDDTGKVITDVLAVWDAEPGSYFGRGSSGKENGGGLRMFNGSMQTVDDDDEFEPDDERQARPVIKLRGGTSRGLTRSRSRKSLKTVVGREYDEPDVEVSPGYPVSPSSTHGHDQVSVLSPSRRTSLASAKGTAMEPGTATMTSKNGGMFSRADLRARMPFAIIAPERERDKGTNGGVGQNGHALHGVPAPNVSGRFVRRFRWGTVDVLDPQHCDFTALRAAVLGAYMRSLKAMTKDVLYERFRTEKLLARRATANITDTDRQRIYKDLGL